MRPPGGLPRSIVAFQAAREFYGTDRVMHRAMRKFWAPSPVIAALRTSQGPSDRPIPELNAARRLESEKGANRNVT